MRSKCFITADGSTCISVIAVPMLVRMSLKPLPPSLSRVSLEQARLMEYVFITLNLGRHGNAPDNRGWMNLFRSWARSETFQVEFDKIRTHVY